MAIIPEDEIERLKRESSSAVHVPSWFGVLAVALFCCAARVGAEVYSFRTLAGVASEPGDADGLLAAARFTDATGVAVARDGTIYVTETPGEAATRSLRTCLRARGWEQGRTPAGERQRGRAL